MRDFEMRVLFQMSAADSSNLMDSPAASRLGGHTAMFYSEERGQAEKFRPYGLPNPDWLQTFDKRLSRVGSAHPHNCRSSEVGEAHPAITRDAQRACRE